MGEKNRRRLQETERSAGALICVFPDDATYPTATSLSLVKLPRLSKGDGQE